MGNENSTTTEKNRKTTSRTQSISKVSEGPGSSLYYLHPYSHHFRQSHSIANEEHFTPFPTPEQSSPVLFQKRSSGIPLSSLSQNVSNNVSLSQTATANSFEKAPMVQLNYVVKPSKSNLIHTYGSDNITVMRRTSSQSIPHGNRWYDNNYNKNVKPLVVKYL